ncbi:MAG TPA: Do family serine endopeptidase [Sphingobacteriaceae bacterium]|nr:Do family serine endopeptidase [Sphingobacteriaceae bacterium]
MKENIRKTGLTLLTACIGGAVAIGAFKLIEDKQNDNLSFEERQKVYFANNPMPVISSTDNPDFTQAAASVTPAVVHIKTTYSGGANAQGGGGDSMEDMFEEFFGRRGRPQGPQMASGSGVIISVDGYIVTNNHVVENADKIDVILPDKRSFQAKVIGKDSNTDLALIKIDGQGFPIVKLGNSDDVRVGEWVLAVGYPFALNTTVTAGIVSAKGRSIGILDGPRRNQQGGAPQPRTAIESFIQTDAAINRGNSGGALVNTRGELIGINAAIASQSGSYEGYGFAIPINLAKKVLDDFKQFGSIKRGFIGVSFAELDAERSKELGISQINGLYVSEVVPGGGGEAAGLKKGDIITKVNGAYIESSSDLQERVGRLRPGDKIQLAVLRDDKERNVSVTLKGESSLGLASNNTRPEGGATVKNLGASFTPVTAAQKSRFRINSGVVVSNVVNNGIFSTMDIPSGTIITSVNGRAVNNAQDVNAALSAGRNAALFDTITPDGARMKYQFQVR